MPPFSLLYSLIYASLVIFFILKLISFRNCFTRDLFLYEAFNYLHQNRNELKKIKQNVLNIDSPSVARGLQYFSRRELN